MAGASVRTGSTRGADWAQPIAVLNDLELLRRNVKRQNLGRRVACGLRLGLTLLGARSRAVSRQRTYSARDGRLLRDRMDGAEAAVSLRSTE